MGAGSILNAETGTKQGSFLTHDVQFDLTGYSLYNALNPPGKIGRPIKRTEIVINSDFNIIFFNKLLYLISI